MASPLADLDELILLCRDKKAQSYIKEAVSCYKTGAFRSAIVSTWIAVSFDIIDKLKELTLAGDKEAELQIAQLEKARSTGDIASSLKFERDILAVCRDKLELISHVEFIDLDRLQQDRNRCAHPSMTADGEIFNPSAELARVHIRSAVEHLLRYPPAQGKHALEALISEISSEYFPMEITKAVIAFKSSPLFKARESLIRNLVLVILKRIIKNEISFKEQQRMFSALKAIQYIHREVFSSALKEKIPGVVRAIDDTKLYKVFPLLEAFDDLWGCLEAGFRLKLESYVSNLPSEKIELLEGLCKYPELKIFASIRAAKISRSEFAESIFFDVPQEIISRVIDLYAGSESFDQANSFASTVLIYVSDFSKEQIEKIIKACGANEQLRHSFEIGSVISGLRKSKKVNESEINLWLSKADLKKYIKESVETDA